MSQRMGFERPAESTRYDPETQKKVIALASRLQQQHQEGVTAEEIMAAGDEVGLEPAFVRRAILRLEGARAAPTGTTGHHPWIKPGRFRGAGIGLTALLGLYPPLAWCAFIASGYLGSVSPNRREAFWTGAGAYGAAALVRTIVAQVISPGMFEGQPWPVILILSALVGGGMGLFGDFLRTHLSDTPAAAPAPIGATRAVLLEQLDELLKQLDAQKRRAAFLSVDVVGSSSLKRGGDERLIELAFDRYRRWFEQAVRARRGQVQVAAGDGVMCLFAGPRPEAAAARAARELLVDLERFNREENPLPAPFAVRCGVSAGDVPLASDVPLGYLQSPVIDRAAVLQKRAEPGHVLVSAEAAEAALPELRGLTAVENGAGDPVAFSWGPASAG